jgi:hypothetical protein
MTEAERTLEMITGLTPDRLNAFFEALGPEGIDALRPQLLTSWNEYLETSPKELTQPKALWSERCCQFYLKLLDTLEESELTQLNRALAKFQSMDQKNEWGSIHAQLLRKLADLLEKSKPQESIWRQNL